MWRTPGKEVRTIVIRRERINHKGREIVMGEDTLQQETLDKTVKTVKMKSEVEGRVKTAKNTKTITNVKESSKLEEIVKTVGMESEGRVKTVEMESVGRMKTVKESSKLEERVKNVEMKSKGRVTKLSELESVRGKILSKRIVDVKTVRKRKERPGGLSLSWDPGVGGGAGDLPDGEHHGGRGERDRHNKLNLKTEIKHQDTSIFINNINKYRYEQETVKDLVGVFEDVRQVHGGEGGSNRDGFVAERTTGYSPRKRRKC